MRISGSPAPSLPPANHTRSTGRPEAAFPAEADKPHGRIGAAEHSHRSDVAALRQWINHPDLRENLTLPDLSAEHNGNGFAKVVATYEAVIAIGNPSTDPNPAPVVTGSEPPPNV